MFLTYLAAIWSAIAPAMWNHLWQSTVFLVAAGLLTLVLRKNRANVRYALWLAASVKFLVPFSLMVVLGSHLPWPHASTQVNAGLALLVQGDRDLVQPAISLVSPANPALNLAPLNYLPAALFITWLCGFLMVALLWLLRFRRISQVVRQARPLHEGRELKTLRSLERLAGVRRSTTIMAAQTTLEPGIFGIVRPVLVWPDGISARLEDSNLEAILVHELSHIRRRDNLTAAVHMLVETIFWFHPLVWWLGARLVEERERACDEEALVSGRDRQVYGESILKVCEFCVESPLSCISGVTGADLKKRLVRIMNEPVAGKLGVPKKALLAVAGTLAIALPIVAGALKPVQSGTSSSLVPSRAETRLAFEAASVKENRSGSESSTMNVPIGPGEIYPPNDGVLSATNIPLVSFIYFAFDLSGSQFQMLLPTLPDWVVRDRFDIQARAHGNPTKDEMRRMVQTLLEERFKLRVHSETQQRPVYALVLDEARRTGPKLQPHPQDSSCDGSSGPADDSGGTAATLSNGLPASCGGIVGLPSSPSGRLRVGARNIALSLVAATLPQIGNLDRPVMDKTGLKGTFDFNFEWTAQLAGATSTSGVPRRLAEPGPTLVKDLKEQLGLKLVPENGPVEVFVVDHAEKPSDN